MPLVLFQTTKIQTFESNSQPSNSHYCVRFRCFRLQRYKLLKAIHNAELDREYHLQVVSDYKDTNFWKQFTTSNLTALLTKTLFQTTKIQTFESNSQLAVINLLYTVVVSDYKDTNFWKQFTTSPEDDHNGRCCFRLQRYKFLKAIHNSIYLLIRHWWLFQTTKIQIFESNSQLSSDASSIVYSTGKVIKKRKRRFE